VTAVRNFLLLFALAALSCGPARNGLADAINTAPRRADCAHGTYRCNGLVPEACVVADNAGRWYPLHPRREDGTIAPCRARCVVDGDPVRAHCAAEEGGALRSAPADAAAPVEAPDVGPADVPPSPADAPAPAGMDGGLP
jgi:hypothetical protein